MYVGRSQTIRQHMAGNPLIATIRYIAGTRPVFRISEILKYLDSPASVDEVYRTVAPELPRLGLVATRRGDDIEIRRFVPASLYLPNETDRLQWEAFLTGRQVPPVLTDAIERYISRKTGRPWNDPVILEKLRHAITTQKDEYWRSSAHRILKYVKGYSVLSYLAYHLPVYFMQTEHLLARLALEGYLKKTMTILDVGTGPGVVPLAIADFWSRIDGASASVWSLERSDEHIEAFLFLRDSFVPRGGRVSVKPPKKADLHDPLPSTLPEKIDLAIFSNVLNELPDTTTGEREEIVQQIARRLAPDGAILIVEPADEENATRMRTLVSGLHGRGLVIHAPCTFIWGSPCKAPRCWSFTTAPAIRPTRLMEALAAGNDAYRYINTDIKYCYAVLRLPGYPDTGYRVPRGRNAIRFSKLNIHTGRRVNLVAVKMSGDLGDHKTHLFKVCDGTAKTPVYAVLPEYHRTPENEALLSATYGAVLEMQGVLVRYNPSHDAYNLFVNRNTGVRPA